MKFMSEVSTRSRCQSLTHAGQPCKNYTLPDSNYCRAHQPANPSGDHFRVEQETPIEDSIVIEEPPSSTLEETLDGPEPEVSHEAAAEGERQQLSEELDEMIDRVKATAPDYTPPPFSPRALIHLIEQNLEHFSPEMRLEILEKLRSTITEDLFDLDTWRGIWYMLNYSIESQTDWLKRRLNGDYETDEWGLDRDVLEAVQPFFNFMYRNYWKCKQPGSRTSRSRAGSAGRQPFRPASLG
jgi:hypothetical protein